MMGKPVDCEVKDSYPTMIVLRAKFTSNPMGLPDDWPAFSEAYTGSCPQDWEVMTGAEFRAHLLAHKASFIVWDEAQERICTTVLGNAG